MCSNIFLSPTSRYLTEDSLLFSTVTIFSITPALQFLLLKSCLERNHVYIWLINSVKLLFEWEFTREEDVFLT